MKQELRRALAALKKQYKKILREGDTSGDAAPLGDNYILLRSALQGALRFLAAHKKDDYSALWAQCGAYYQRAAEVREASLVSFFAAAEPDLLFGAALGVLLPARIAAFAAVQFGEPPSAPSAERPFTHAVKSLFCLREIDFEAVFPAVCKAERLLCRDADYLRCDPETKDRYRSAVIRLARKTGKRQEDVILEALSDGKHIGFSLPVVKKRTGGAIFLAAEALCALALAVCTAVFCRSTADGFFRSAPG